MTGVRPFQVSIPQVAVDDLRERLARTRWAPALDDGEWTYGTPTAYLAELVEYWLTEFDWRAAERQLNEMPQFRAVVDDVDVHFVHVKGVGPRPFPLLFTHGWPGSFWEVHKIIGPLTDPAAHGGHPSDSFDVVAPSLPGYGFSTHPGTPGMATSAIAEMFHSLMKKTLGYQSYGAQGGDWGALVTTCLGRDHAHSVTGIHLNLMAAALPLVLADPAIEAEIRRYQEGVVEWANREAAYGRIQGTKPATLAAALSDSPTGLAAWIVEKFRSWSDCDGDVESVFSKDELLTNITLYWLTNTIGTSMRLYYENEHDPLGPMAQFRFIDTPTGFAAFPKEITAPSETVVAQAYNLRRFTEFGKGGHFAALERPAELVTEIREFFRPLRE